LIDENVDDFSLDDVASILLDGTSTETNVTTSGISQCTTSSLVDDDQHDQATIGKTVDFFDSSQGSLWCYCQVDKQDEMVGCDNEECLIQWFHLSCLNLTVEQLLLGDWFCPECS